MSNLCCISKDGLKRLYLDESRVIVRHLVDQFKSRMSLDEILHLAKEEASEVEQFFRAEIDKFSNKTENVEIQTAFELSDFYFGAETDTKICFEMKTSFPTGKPIERYGDLVSGIENNTEVDCLVVDGDKGKKFQIKRYPQKYKAYDNQTLLEYIQSTNAGYADMEDTALVVLLQPIPGDTSSLDFSEISKTLILQGDIIKFSDILFTFNLNNQYSVLTRVFPDFSTAQKELQWRSDNISSFFEG